MFFILSITIAIIRATSGQATTLTNSAACTYSFVVPATEGLCSVEEKQEVTMLRQHVRLLEEMMHRLNVTQQLNIQLAEEKFQRVNLTQQLTEQQFKNQVQNLADELNQVKQESQTQLANITAIFYQTVNQGGAVYVRWGRTVCPDSASKVYDGVVGGSSFRNSGGGAEKLCLPTDPEWGQTTDGLQSNSFLDGAEYEVYPSNNPFSTENARDVSTLKQQDVVCAVCQTPTRLSHLMIPAKKTCPEGWTKEYDGYLMAERYTHQRSSFNCVDKAPEVRPGGGADLNGALFYNVEARCSGSLPCGPYVNGWEITCVVCTK